MSIAAKITFLAHCFAKVCFLHAFIFSAVSDISHLSSLWELCTITHVYSLSITKSLPWVFSLLPAPVSLIFLSGTAIHVFILSTMLHIELPVNTCEGTSLASFQFWVYALPLHMVLICTDSSFVLYCYSE